MLGRAVGQAPLTGMSAPGTGMQTLTPPSSTAASSTISTPTLTWLNRCRPRGFRRGLCAP